MKVIVYLPAIKWALEVQQTAMRENLVIFLTYHQLRLFEIELLRYAFIFLVRFSSTSFCLSEIYK